MYSIIANSNSVPVITVANTVSKLPTPNRHVHSHGHHRTTHKRS